LGDLDSSLTVAASSSIATGLEAVVLSNRRWIYAD
jgi:hypothetical protein